MRISADPEDIGYVEDTRHVSVLLNGIEQKMVLTADEEEGYIIQAVLDFNGDFVNDGVVKITYETVRGDVKIVFGDVQDKGE